MTLKPYFKPPPRSGLGGVDRGLWGREKGRGKKKKSQNIDAAARSPDSDSDSDSDLDLDLDSDSGSLLEGSGYPDSDSVH